jgi:single-strand DNA-binding protein
VRDRPVQHDVRGLEVAVDDALFVGRGQLYVEGSLQTRDWTDRDGIKCYTTEAVGRVVLLLGKRADVETPAAPDEAPADGEAEPPEDIPF